MDLLEDIRIDIVKRNGLLLIGLIVFDIDCKLFQLIIAQDTSEQGSIQIGTFKLSF